MSLYSEFGGFFSNIDFHVIFNRNESVTKNNELLKIRTFQENGFHHRFLLGNVPKTKN